MGVCNICTILGHPRAILLVCAEACAARRSAAEGSAEWHKRTGEILACGKLPNVLCNLQESIRAQDFPRPSPLTSPSSASRSFPLLVVGQFPVNCFYHPRFVTV
jgi:hypothetical protein